MAEVTNKKTLKLCIWNEFIHEKEDPKVKEIYPDGIHKQLGNIFKENENVEIHYATLNQADHGLSDQVLEATDVLIWWGHAAHDQVSDDIVEKIQEKVLKGMGLIVLHSAHMSKIFMRLMGTSCDLKWREKGEKERLWVVEPSHPIMRGIDECIELEEEEMYGEFFDVPAPDELLMLSWFQGGEVFRSAMTYKRGKGKIFYFRPGHETYPSYYHPQIQKVIYNAVLWAKPTRNFELTFGYKEAMEEL